jgi:hypothetical protein
MIVGFTGTQEGQTVKQQGDVLRWMGLLGRSMTAGEERIFRHGVCVGADAEAHAVAWALKWTIDGFPSTVQSKRADVPREQFRHLWQSKEPLARNCDIVDGKDNDRIDLLIVTPRERREIVRSGTWATYRYARAKGVNTLILWP